MIPATETLRNRSRIATFNNLSQIVITNFPPYCLSGAMSSSTDKEKESGDSTQINDKPIITTTRLELWSYYLYYIGNNGLLGSNFGPSQFQNLLFLAGYDPSNGPFTTPCGTGSCVLPYLGQVRDSEYSISPQNCGNWTKPNSPNS